MFKRAVLKLTCFYSFLFFLLFWSFSIGLYAYLDHTFKQGYVTQVKERVRHEVGKTGAYQSFTEFSVEHSNTFFNKSAEVTLENFRKGLISVNLIFILFIPTVAWLLAKKTLSPIRDILQRQKQFVSDASHELLTPLTIISNEIEVALRQQREMSYYVRTLDTIKGEISRLSGLVSNLLILAKHEDTVQSIPMQEVELVDVVGRAVSACARKFQGKAVRYTVNFPEENIVVKGNNTMLEQLFTNLLDNAFKFSPADTNITVSMQKKGRHAEVSIQDKGIGIPKEEQEKIFDRFYRIDTSRTQTQGYGLGLSIARTIVELHGGSIDIHSYAGRGSTFTVTLPAVT